MDYSFFYIKRENLNALGRISFHQTLPYLGIRKNRTFEYLIASYNFIHNDKMHMWRTAESTKSWEVEICNPKLHN